MVALHGFTGVPVAWDEVRRALPAEVELHCPALLGHGAESGSAAGFGAEVVATVAQNMLLKSPPVRLGSPRGLIAYAPNLENQMRVTAEMIAAAAKKTMEFEAA